MPPPLLTNHHPVPGSVHPLDPPRQFCTAALPQAGPVGGQAAAGQDGGHEPGGGLPASVRRARPLLPLASTGRSPGSGGRILFPRIRQLFSRVPETIILASASHHCLPVPPSCVRPCAPCVPSRRAEPVLPSSLSPCIPALLRLSTACFVVLGLLIEARVSLRFSAGR